VFFQDLASIVGRPQREPCVPRQSLAVVHQRDRSARSGVVRVEQGHDVGLQSATGMSPRL